MKMPAASGARLAGTEGIEKKLLIDRPLSTARPVRQIPSPNDAPPAPWQHLAGPLARVVADIETADVARPATNVCF